MISTTIQEMDFKVLAGALSYLPGDDSVIYVNQTMSEAEKQETILQLQIAFYALPPAARLFPVKLELRGTFKPRVVLEDLKGIAGVYMQTASGRATIIVNQSLSEANQVATIARGMLFWQMLPDEKRQEPLKAVL